MVLRHIITKSRNARHRRCGERKKEGVKNKTKIAVRASQVKVGDKELLLTKGTNILFIWYKIALEEDYVQYNTISFIEDDKKKDRENKDGWHRRNWDLLHDGD